MNDKMKHALAGFAIALSVGLWSPIAGIVLAVASGIAKEIWDARHPPHVSDVNDALATAAGGAFGTVIAVVASAILHA